MYQCLQVWNEELAAAAQNFSLMCRLASNPDRASQVPSFQSVGENWTAAGTLGQPNFTTLVNIAWFNQRFMYNFTQNSCSTRDACLFYTQVYIMNIIANSTKSFHILWMTR